MLQPQHLRSVIKPFRLLWLSRLIPASDNRLMSRRHRSCHMSFENTGGRVGQKRSALHDKRLQPQPHQPTATAAAMSTNSMYPKGGRSALYVKPLQPQESRKERKSHPAREDVCCSKEASQNIENKWKQNIHNIHIWTIGYRFFKSPLSFYMVSYTFPISMSSLKDLSSTLILTEPHI